ncbi:hypothetical protein J9303_03690 [Bacillaceae bacterium Marseille-Q3522]|nr:hypothetical protein [Bacillaceae bacterium Marseille-Q3522]
MKILHSLIGEHYFRLNCPNQNWFTALKEKFGKYPGEPVFPDLTIDISDLYGSPFQNYHVTVTKDEGKTYYRRTDYYIETDFAGRTAKIAAFDLFSLKHALLNLYSAYIVHQQWGMLMHASCVVENEKAHIFTGHSGAGKSTVAALSAPREILADEASIVKVSNQEIIVYDSPFRSELQQQKERQKAELASIQLLQQSASINRQALHKADALLKLVDKVFFWTADPQETKQIWKLLRQLIIQIPVYKLRFQKNNRFWELMRS